MEELQNETEESPNSQTSDPAVTTSYLVRNPHTNESCIACSSETFSPGAGVVLPTRYGVDMGVVLGKVKDPDCSACGGCAEQSRVVQSEQQGGSARKKGQKKKREKHNGREIYTIMRKANEKDLEKYEKNLLKEMEAFKVCKEKIYLRKLAMKLVSAHYLLGESKVLFFFTADSRVDFRELVKDLVSVFKTRIELRQIGVRDESRVVGGLAVCGRDYCCHSISDKLKPVSIKMAKEQNLSLNSMKISGPCGRLLCCLSYEYDFYREEKRKMPSAGSKLKIEDALFKVTDVNILSKKVYLNSMDGRMLAVPFEKLSFTDKRWSIDKEFLEEKLNGREEEKLNGRENERN